MELYPAIRLNCEVTTLGRTEIIKRIYDTLSRDNSFIVAIENSPEVLSGQYTQRRKAIDVIGMVIDEFRETVIDALVNDGKVTFSGIGTLEIVEYKNRAKYDFQAKEVVNVPGIKMVKFKISDKLKQIAKEGKI
jgi:nucleoid DNA-binding protein